MAKYDWLQAYEAANNGTYGDPTDLNQGGGMLQRIKDVAGQDYLDAVSSGVIGEDGRVNWERAPALPGYNSAGGNAAPNMMLQATGGRAGMVNPDGSAITQGYGGGALINNSDYGSQYVAQRRAPDDLGMKLGRMGALAMFMGPTAAALGGAASGALGFTPGGAASSAVTAGVRALPSLAMSGGRGLGGTLGSLLGGLSGVPGGSQIGGLAGNVASGGGVNATQTIGALLRLLKG